MTNQLAWAKAYVKEYKYMYDRLLLRNADLSLYKLAQAIILDNEA